MPPIKFDTALSARLQQRSTPHQAQPAAALQLQNTAKEKTKSQQTLSSRSAPLNVAAPPSTTSFIKKAAPFTARLNATAAMQNPWLMHVTTATQELPLALRGVAIQGAVFLSSRLAPLTLPALTLASALYPRALGLSNLPVPLPAHDTEGFKPLDAHGPAQAGVPHTEYTRPRTEPKRELPITATTEAQLHLGGAPVQPPAIPGKALHPHRAMDDIHRAEKVSTDEAMPTLEKLTFSDVVASESSMSQTLGAAQNKMLRLNFEAGKYGEGMVSLSLNTLNQADHHYVVAPVEKSAKLPNRLMGKILARTMGFENGFIPREALWLRVRYRTADTSLGRGRTRNSALGRGIARTKDHSESTS